jgi:hypothetical protein
MLESLLTSRQLHVLQRGEVLTAHPNFCLFSTMQVEGGNGRWDIAIDANALSPWWMITLPRAKRKDQLAVLSGRFPKAGPLLLPTMALAEIVCLASSAGVQKDASASAEEDFPLWAQWHNAVLQAMVKAELSPAELMLSLGKKLGMHDLVKMCSRLVQLHMPLLTCGIGRLNVLACNEVCPADVLALSVELRKAMLTEASDILCGFATGEVWSGFHKTYCALASLGACCRFRSSKYWIGICFLEVRLCGGSDD